MATPPDRYPHSSSALGGEAPPAYEEVWRSRPANPQEAAAYDAAAYAELNSAGMSQGERNRLDLDRARAATGPGRGAGWQAPRPVAPPVQDDGERNAQNLQAARDASRPTGPVLTEGERNARDLAAAREAARAATGPRQGGPVPVRPSGPPMSQSEREARDLNEARRRARVREIEQAPTAPAPARRSLWEREPQGTRWQQPGVDARLQEESSLTVRTSLAQTRYGAPNPPVTGLEPLSPDSARPGATSGPMGAVDPFAFTARQDSLASTPTTPVDIRNPLSGGAGSLLPMDPGMSQDVTRWGVSAQQARNPLGNAANTYAPQGAPSHDPANSRRAADGQRVRQRQNAPRTR
ncbi:hypothetical protein ACIQKE_27155 [Streptomyces griseoviridis]